MADANLIVMPALIMGAVIGLIEMFFVHADEIGMGWFMHGLHALPATMFFTFVSMNIAWTMTILPFSVPGGFLGELAVRAVIALIAMIKIQTAAAIAGKVGVRIQHTLVLGAMIMASPYIWMILDPFVPVPNLPF